MRSRGHDGFFTPEMDQAERELDARIDYAMSQARDVQAKVDEFEQKLAEDSEPPSDEEVDRIKKFVLGHARTDEWQLVIDRIDRGELTWRQVVEGLATGRLDRGVSAAFESLSKVPPASLEELIEIGVFPVQLPGEPAAEDEAGEDQPGTPDDGFTSRFTAHDDDEWFDEGPPPWRA